MAENGPEEKKDPFDKLRTSPYNEGKEDLFTPTGELKGGYDLGMARAYALEHAKKTQGERVGARCRSFAWMLE